MILADFCKNAIYRKWKTKISKFYKLFTNNLLKVKRKNHIYINFYNIKNRLLKYNLFNNKNKI